MRGKRKSKSVNRMEQEPYASYPLPQQTTNLEEAVAWVAAGRGSLRQAMRLFTVDKKTMKKNLLRFMNSEPVLMGRPGPPPRVRDDHMRKWLEQQPLSSLTPYKVDIVEEACRHAEEQGFKLGSGDKWWRLFKARNMDVVSRTPGLVESQRADSRLDEEQWRDFFAEASGALAEVDYDGQYIVNMDETCVLALCKCPRETVHSSESRRLPRFTKETKHSSTLTIKHCMVLQKGILQPFARKKYCTVLKKQTRCMGLPNGRHPPFARNKTVHSFPKK